MGMNCTADFCLVPMGTASPSVGAYIARCQQILERSGLKYELHGYGTGLEGDFTEVCEAIRKCHEAVHEMGCPRIATDIRIGTRMDKASSLEQKVQSVRDHLARGAEDDDTGAVLAS
ncbi:hypothetical protein SAICODRAFT_34261 [Saitoella complicata NRRL Y-17804]|uniref:Thiamine-binding protein domain-containing protein n=1 Tax=Saitoella complicata (strain BCRC 22490 / CBS 7301 / JCM 7358 / NBRC 10748 / NRRL Y-17804) TaxID=698492 RepID=A0A0E9NH61_SAICN|nr:uncharacterized protein SAICODRAFT_34261 [Saitoella complicata NRRL Y-17804]ODQ54072.1 hypothetical protein SAICODRAFT_34261 [Saitoella complicata NRRL Y-17804]GAO49148.1 hypothetical protein G7K_3306-t1 [Saitoella complicata NRRL Y-17804]